MPIQSQEKLLGIFVIRLEKSVLNERENRLLSAWVRLAGVAMEKIHLAEEARQAKLVLEGEKLRKALFNSVSHELDVYKRQAYNNSKIEYKGFIKPEEFYPQIDVLIVPSIWNEPLGRVVFEAYSYGIPVIASKRGGITEIVKEGETGYLFEPFQKGELLMYIEKFTKKSVDISEMSKRLSLIHI